MNEKDIERFNDVFPLGYMPHERIEWAIKNYVDLERKRMEAWGMLQEIRKHTERNDLTDIIDITPMINSEATYEDGILRITVFDYLPRKCLIEKKGAITELTKHWLSSINDAVQRLRETGVEVFFEKADCFIYPFVPHNREVDSDNMAYEIIINALRYNGIVPNDSIKELAFRVQGDIDKDNPRTEIYVFKQRNFVEELGLRKAKNSN